MKKKIMPTICTIGLVLSNTSNRVYALEGTLKNDKLEKEYKEYKEDNSVTEKIYMVEDMEFSEYEDLKQELTYINIVDENLLIAINEALNKEDLYDSVTLKEMTSLEYLNLSDRDIVKLNGIEFAKNLKILDLSNNAIEDIKPISTLYSLEELNLSNNNIEDITGIKDLKKLKKLDLSNIVRSLNLEKDEMSFDETKEDKYNSIKNISAISGLSNLLILNLSNNEIEDIKPLFTLKNLKSLNLSGNSISNISDINNMSYLNSLNLSNQVILENKVKVIGEDLNYRYNIKDEKNKIINPSFISKNGVLENETIKWKELDEYTSNLEVKFGKEVQINDDLDSYFSGKIIQSIEVDKIIEIEDSILLNSINNALGKSDLESSVLKSELESLEYLKIENPKLKSLKGLEHAVNIKELTIRNTNIENFDNISNLSNLVKLDLMDNNITNIDFLNNMIDLEYLNLEGNSIISANSIKYNLSLLKELNLSYNNLYSVDLKGLNNLCSVNLSNNHISRVEGIEELENLQILNLNGNNIGDISRLSELKNLSKLSVENQTVYLPVLSSRQRTFNIKNPILNIDNTSVSPIFISEEGYFNEEVVYWDNLDEDVSVLNFDFNGNIEKENLIIGNFSGSVVQPLEIELFSSENYLSLSLSTNQIKFENFTGISDMEKLNAIEMNIDSIKAYDIFALIPNEIKNSDGTKTLSPNALSVRESTSPDYVKFENINQKILLIENLAPGVNTHTFDFKLNKDSFSEKDSYRAVIRFEINQK